MRYVTGLICASLLGLVGCKDPKTQEAGAAFDRSSLLRSFSQDTALPTYREAATAAAALEKAAADLAAQIASGATDVTSSLAAARDAWRAGAAAWQRAEMMQVGPAAAEGEQPGGEGLRDRIYSWPTVNFCRVDEELVANKFAAPGFFESALVNVYGYDALEYLLFYAGSTNACPPQVEINQGAWGALTPVELQRRRAEYAKAVAAQIRKDVDALVTRWEKSFAAELAAPGGVFEDEGEAVDALISALFYLEFVVKDHKLAEPLGISEECNAEVCLDALEFPWSNYSREAILANLEGFRRMYTGGLDGTGYGFEDALRDRGADGLADEMNAAWEGAHEAFSNLDGTLYDAIKDRPAEALSAYNKLKSLTDLLKGRFVTTLRLEVPEEGKGDTD